jgi:methionine synthase reductase
MLHILFASQTGCAESIARTIYAEALSHGYDSKTTSVGPLNDSVDLSTINLAVLVVSSTGQGDPPEHSLSFMRKLRATNRKTPKWLSHLRFALLGLGDSNYDDFQGNPKNLARQLLAAGAQEFHPRAAADDAVGLDDTVEPWKAALWDSLLLELPPSCPSTDHSSTSSPSTDTSSSSSSSIDSSSSSSISSSPSSSSSTDAMTNEVSLPSTSSSAPPSLSPAFSSSSSSSSSSSVISRGNILKLSNSPSVPPLKIKIEQSGKEEVGIKPRSENATIKEFKFLGREDHRVVDITFELDEPLAPFLPGDAVSLHCSNDEAKVERLLARLQVEEPDQLVHIQSLVAGEEECIPSHLRKHCPVSLRTIFQDLVDISGAPRRVLLEMLAQHTSDPGEKAALKQLASHKGKEQYRELIDIPCLGLLEVLIKFPSCLPPIDQLLQLLPPLVPRTYSICSAPLHHQKTLRLLIKISQFPSFLDDQVRYGVCSSWVLHHLTSSPSSLSSSSSSSSSPLLTRLEISSRSTTKFALKPEMMSSQIILIATGTGISPFLSFLEHRRNNKKQQEGEQEGEGRSTLPPWHLFYGCRDARESFLCQDELQSCLADGTLSTLSLAFSRETTTPTYVQHLLLDRADWVRSLLVEQSAYCFVCGSQDMIRDVEQTVSSLLGFPIRQLEDRYLIDVW